ncbi:MAG: hypothetical protein IPH12_21780 [Saprospirales bacterium]|nr:hypothetical protein [Saprospirales bacterium]MBK8920539.1 hypothetical protein [Saprospirales bacterium]
MEPYHERQEFVNSWDRIRNKGMVRYMALFALLTGTIITMINYLLDIWGSETTAPAFFSYRMLSTWGKNLLIGAIVGLASWWLTERQYRRYQKELEQKG